MKLGVQSQSSPTSLAHSLGTEFAGHSNFRRPNVGCNFHYSEDRLTALFNNPALLWVLAVTTLTLGLAMVLAHNVWSGGALPVVVTLVGWAVLIKGLLFLFLPSGMESDFILSLLRNPLLFYGCMTPSFVIGIYLAFGGFTSRVESI